MSKMTSRHGGLPLVIALLLSAALPAGAAVWQWSVVVKGGMESAGPARAFLWIPPDCQRVRGVVLAQHNMEEISILENPKFRQALDDRGFAEIWCAPAFDHLFRFNAGAGETFNGLMEALAGESGYAELKFAPVAGLGHSAAAGWPYYFAAWNPERTLAALSVSGQWPYYRDRAFAPDIWGVKTIDFIPALESMGEYEAAAAWSDEGLKERQQHPLMPLSMLANPAQGHFASTDQKVEYLALYLKKAVQYRMPADWTGVGAPKLRPIDPTKAGWLVDRWRFDQPPLAAAAPVGSYQGDPAQAFWFFDEEIARATETYQARYRGLRPQLIGFRQDGQMVPQKDEHLQVTLKFEPQADGVTFKLEGAFYDTVPDGSPRPAQWAGRPAGSPIGHASGGGPISIERICGPFEELAPDTFSLRLQKEESTNEQLYELVVAATHPGDQNYKPAVQQAHLLVPARNQEGRDQKITFPSIPDQRAGAKSVSLTATSDSGAEVCYYVREGPAEVSGATLTLTAIPPHARFPVKVTVVAWQYGRALEPRLKTAEPVERAFSIVK
jgi:hypothetical protein